MIVPLHADNPGPITGSGNWTFLLPGRHPVLIDAGTGAAAHLDALAAAGAEDALHVLVTHGHSDHVSGVGALNVRWPATRFAKFPWPGRDEAHPVAWQALQDGDVVPAGDEVVQVVHTPGHAPDHVAFWHPATRTLFSGDLVVAGSTVVIPASTGGSLADYLRSLERVRDLAPARLLPAHGEPIEDPATLIQHYIAHRREREAQILSVLAEGRQTIDVIVERIYGSLSPPLVPLARESVLAHLVKLADEDRAQHSNEGWELV